MIFTLRGPRSSVPLTSFAIALPIAIAESIRLKTNIFFIVVNIKGLYICYFSWYKGTTQNYDSKSAWRSNTKTSV